MAPSVSILVVNYNAGPHLRSCVGALAKQSHGEFEVIILDNASSDDSIAHAKQAVDGDERFRFVPETRNLGFAEGNNRAAKHANADWIITLNPDAFPEQNWLRNLLTAASGHPDTVVFGSTQLSSDDPSSLDGAGDRYFAGGIPWRDRNPNRIRNAQTAGSDTFETFSACAAAAMYRADVFRSVGGFDGRFFCFAEDVDLGFRLRLRGHRCLQAVNARVVHVGGGAGGGQGTFAVYHGVRNLVWCYAKNMPAPLLIPLLPVHVGAVLALVVRNSFRGLGFTALRAAFAAIGGLSAVREQRRHVQRDRRVGVSDIARALDWNPFALTRR